MDSDGAAQKIGIVKEDPLINKTPEMTYVNDQGLFSLNTKPNFREYIRQLYGRRQFIFEDARGKSTDTYRDLILGRVWIILSPLLDALLYGLVFGVLLQTSRGIENFVGFLVIGIIFFGVLQDGLNSGTSLIRSSQNMIRSFMFPRASIVFSRALRNFISKVMPAMVAITVALVFQWGESPSWHFFLVIPLYLLMHLFSTGLMFIVARLCAFVPDFRALIRVAGRAWFFTSGIFFEVDRYATVPLIQTVMEWNPAYQFLTAVREVIMYQTSPSLLTWLGLATWSVSAFVIGLVFFWGAEEKYGTLR